MDQRKREALMKVNSSRARFVAEMRALEVGVSTVTVGSVVVAEKISIRPARSDEKDGDRDVGGQGRRAGRGSGGRGALSLLASDRMDAHESTHLVRVRRPSNPSHAPTTSVVASNTPASSYTCYAQPPEMAEGTSIDLSDRQLLCGAMSRGEDELLVGSANHSVYSVRFNDKTRKATVRPMHSKRSGHCDWVTSVALTCDRRALSAGMDGKLCLWNEARSSCVDIRAHVGSVSKVLADEDTDLAYSCGYDGKIYAYNTRDKPRGRAGADAGAGYVIGCLSGHSSPVIDMAGGGAVGGGGSSGLVSGARDGDVFVWDSATHALVRRYHGHTGSVTRVLGVEGEVHLWLSAGGDGVVKLFDARERVCVSSVAVRAGDKAPSVGAMACAGSLVLAGGADGGVRVLDLRRAGGGVLREWRLHQTAVYSLCVVGAHVFSGDAQGMVHCLRVDAEGNGALRYGLCGSEMGGVQAMFAARNSLIACGESGKLLVYEF